MTQLDTQPRLIPVAVAAQRLSISRSRAYLLASRGELPGQVRLAGSIRVSSRALDQWIDDQVHRGDAA